ncbi:hypothetical protein LINGRAHAP2_LOCUS19717, partial [Linum grandiflorum]
TTAKPKPKISKKLQRPKSSFPLAVVDCATVSPLGRFTESAPLLYCVKLRPAKSQGPPADLSQISDVGARWGGFQHNSRREPYILFPEIELPDRKAVKEEKSLIAVNSRLQGFWQSSSYYLEDTEDSQQQHRVTGAQQQHHPNLLRSNRVWVLKLHMD